MRITVSRPEPLEHWPSLTPERSLRIEVYVDGKPVTIYVVAYTSSISDRDLTSFAHIVAESVEEQSS